MACLSLTLSFTAAPTGPCQQGSFSPTGTVPCSLCPIGTYSVRHSCLASRLMLLIKLSSSSTRQHAINALLAPPPKVWVRSPSSTAPSTRQIPWRLSSASMAPTCWAATLLGKFLRHCFSLLESHGFLLVTAITLRLWITRQLRSARSFALMMQAASPSIPVLLVFGRRETASCRTTTALQTPVACKTLCSSTTSSASCQVRPDCYLPRFCSIIFFFR
jgi:hypothetical protein